MREAEAKDKGRVAWIGSVFNFHCFLSFSGSLRLCLDGGVEKWEGVKLWEDEKVGG